MKISVSLLAPRALLELADSSACAQRLRAAGSRRTRSAGPRGRRPSARARSRRGRPAARRGSLRGAPPRPAPRRGRRSPGSRPRTAGRASASRAAARSGSRSSPITSMLSSRTGMPSAPRNARALFAFSTTKSLQRRGSCSMRRRRQRLCAASRRAASGWRRGSKDRQPGALEHLGERDQRQADERGRVVGLDARDERDAQALGLGARRRSRRAFRARR